MDEDLRPDLMRIVELLEASHGIGVRGAALPLWLEERLTGAVRALLKARRIELDALLPTLQSEPELLVELANALRVGETRFYRDPAQWEALRRTVIPALWARAGEAQRIMALSAGCSTGEEAWTLAMLLCAAAPRMANAAARVRVVGVDRSEPALVIARAATYDVRGQEYLPRELAQRFLQPAVDGSARVVSELLPLVTFQRRDLARDLPPGRYSLIVCKNVLIYFGDEAQNRLVGDLLSALTDDGILLVARSEVPIVRSLGAEAHEISPGITAFRRH